MLMEAAWCRLSETHVSVTKAHMWGTPMYLGVTLVKLRQQSAGSVRLQGMLDVVRTEFSPPLAVFVVNAHS